MGEIIEFPSNGATGRGYLAVPATGSGPGVVVIQEWWGLVPHIQDVCDRLAAEGYVALAPDLYNGETTTEPDEAAKKMMAMSLEKAAKDMSGAVDYVRDHSTGKVGVIGFCMGGGLALVLAVQRADAISAAVPFYGVIPWPGAEPDWSKLTAAVQGHYAGDDSFAPPESVRALEERLLANGAEVEMYIYAGTQHAFFNDARPEVHDPGAASKAWGRTLAFFQSRLG